MADYQRERRVFEERDSDRTRSMEPAEEYRRTEREVVHQEAPDEDYFRRRIIYYRITNVIWTIIGFIEVLIGLRVLLRLIAANPGNPFVNFIYDLSGVFVNPFLGIVNDPTSGNAVLEVNSLIAMLVYLLLGWGLVRLTWLLFDLTAPAVG